MIDIQELSRVKAEAAAWCRFATSSRAPDRRTSGSTGLGGPLARPSEISWRRLQDLITRRRRLLEINGVAAADLGDRLLIRFYGFNLDFGHVGAVAPSYFSTECDVQVLDTWVWIVAERDFPNLVSVVLREDVHVVADALDSNPDDSFQWIDEIDEGIARNACVPEALVEYATKTWRGSAGS